MSYYVHGSNLSYLDYLQKKSFHDDIIKSSNAITCGINRRTRELIGSVNALSQENAKIIEKVSGEIAEVLGNGFDQISEELDHISIGIDNIASEINRLNASFHWGFSRILSELGRMQDTLVDLLKAATTPAQTAAYEHFEIARDAFRKKLYPECLDSLDKAINGDHNSTGYKLEWRFYRMAGTIRMGFFGSDLSLVDQEKAEKYFLLAARYAELDFPLEASLSYLSAGWAKYLDGKIEVAIEHVDKALKIAPDLGEGFFLKAKFYLSQNYYNEGFESLREAIKIDRRYAVKAAVDGDFVKHENKLQGFFKNLSDENYHKALPDFLAVNDKFAFYRNNIFEHKEKITGFQNIDNFIKFGKDLPVLDQLVQIDKLKDIEQSIKIQIENEGFICNISIKTGNLTFEKVEPFWEEEFHDEEVIVRPKGFFRKAVTKLVTKPRLLKKQRKLLQTTDGIDLELRSGLGNNVATIKFIKILPGAYSFENKELNITEPFFITTNPITVGLWKTIMKKDLKGFGFEAVKIDSQGVLWEDYQLFLKRINRMTKFIARLPKNIEKEYASCIGQNLLHLVLEPQA